MALNSAKYFGATIVNFRGQLGWGAQKSSVDVTLVEDLNNGDSFITPTVGFPTYFAYESWTFGGIIQSWNRNRGSSGFLYDINITDPREILMGTNVILNGYNGLTYSIPNLYNVFAYLESTNGFGGSRNTENGSLALLVTNTLQTLNNTSPITFRGYSYYVDLKNLIKIIPQDYRIPADTIDIFSLISTIAEDFNYDFFIRLEFTSNQNRIVPYFYNKSIAPVFGQIQNYVDFTQNTYGNVSNSVGRELANDTTSKFIVGGQVAELVLVEQNIDDRILTAQDFETSDAATLNMMIANNVNFAKVTIKDYQIEKAKEANIWPFWGHDARGDVIIGYGPPDSRWSEDPTLFFPNGKLVIPPKHTFSGSHKFTIDGRQIAYLYDDPGLIDYPTDTMEMRVALNGFDAWIQYILLTSALRWHSNYNCFNGDSKFTKLFKGGIENPLADLITEITLNSIKIFEYYAPGVPTGHLDIANDIYSALSNYVADIKSLRENSAKEIVEMGGDAVAQVNEYRKIEEVYSFISNYASEYYGKKYMVKIPDIYAYRDTDSLDIKYSVRPVDGAYFSESILPVAVASGFAPPELDLFITDDNRIKPYSRFRFEKTDFTKIDKRHSIPTYDLNNPNDKTPYYIFINSSLDDNIVFLNYETLEDPRIVVNVNQMMHRETEITQASAPFDYLIYEHVIREVKPGLVLLGSWYDGVTDEIWEAICDSTSVFGEEVRYDDLSGCIQMPDLIALSLESQLQTYGPWYIAGLAGKTEFEKDTNLVPWNFNGYTGMNAAARAKLFQTAVNRQEIERGNIEFPGAPTFLLGDSMVSNGPVITDINVNFDPQGGVTTTYNLQTWTPQFGGMSKFYVDKITRLSKRETIQKFRNIKNAALPSSAGQTSAFDLGVSPNPGMQKKPPRKNSSSSCNLILGADVLYKVDSSGNRNNVRANVVTMPGYYLANQTYDGYDNKALASIDAIFRPFVTETEVDESGFPHFERPDDGAEYPTVNNLNPYGIHHDIAVVGKNIELSGVSDTTKPFHNDHLIDPSDVAPTSVKSIALKGPLVIAGWGYDIEGNPVPVNPNNESEFIEDYQKRMDQWKCGPVDLRWDDSRKVWAAGGGNTILFGKAVNNIFAGSSGLVSIFDLASGHPFDVYTKEGNVYAYDMLLQDNTYHVANTTLALTKIGNRYFIINAGCSSC